MLSRFPSAAAAAALLVVVLLAANADAVRGKKFSDSFLEPHNAARHAVGLPPLVWDEKAAAYARQYAARRSADCALVHSHGPYGENLFRGSGVGWRPADVVAAWVREKRYYDRASNTFHAGGWSHACGHYTQIVWRNTKAVGCALAACDRGRSTFGICSYSPPGNYVGMKPY